MGYQRDANGKIIFPEKSFKGAFRAQAERIIRTIAGDKSDCAKTATACYIDSTERACKSITQADEVETKLCLACRIFGGNGWKSPVEFFDFKCVEAGKEEPQEFVAIDRFTGGAMDGAKFNALSCYKPVFEGKIRVNLDPKRGVDEWGLGILALTMRDFIEGDVRLGLGTAKGYGECAVEIVSWTLRGEKPELDGVKNGDGELPLQPIQNFLETCVQATRNKIQGENKYEGENRENRR